MSLEQDLINKYSPEEAAPVTPTAQSTVVQEDSPGSFSNYGDDLQKASINDLEASLMGKYSEEDATTEVPKNQSLIDQVSEEYRKKGLVNDNLALSLTKGSLAGVGQAVEGVANLALDAGNAFEGMAQKMGYDVNLIPDDAQVNVVEKVFGEPKSTLEHAARFYGQYVAPFGLVSKLSKASGAVGVIKNVGISSLISTIIQDPGDERLSNLVQSNPALANPITEFLATDKDDPRLLGRVKTALEAATVDLATMGIAEAGGLLFKGLRATKQLRKARELEKISKADPIPSGSIIDEATIQQNEVRINQEFQEEASQAGAKATGAEGVQKGPNAQKIKEAVNPELPPTPPPSEEEISAIRKAEKIAGVEGSLLQPEDVKAQNMGELIEELKSSGRKFNAEDLHRVAKRGVVSDAENKKLAENLFNQEDKVDELLNRKFGESLNQEEREALKIQYMKEHMDLNTVISGVKDIDNLSPAELSAIQEQITKVHALEASIDASSSEMGRGLRTARKNYDGVLSGTDDALKAKKIKEYLSLHGGVEDVKNTIKQIKQLQESGVSTLDLMRHKMNSGATKMADAAFEMWVNNVLSGPSTWLETNPVSNIANSVASVADTAVGEVFGRLMGKGVVEGETVAQFSGFMDGMSEAWDAARKILNGKVELPAGASKYTFSRRKALSSSNFNLDPLSMLGRTVDVVGHAWNTPTRLLTAQDVFFNMIAQRARLSQLAHRQAITQGLEVGSHEYQALVKTLREQPTASMMKEAERFSEELTLTTPLGSTQGLGFGPAKVTGEFVQKLQAAMERVPLGRYAGAFMRVSTNLADQAIQRTPLSFLRPETRRMLRSGSPVRVQEEIAKMTVGTGLLFTGGVLAHKGLITGSGPDDPKMKKALKSSGWQPDSLRLPGGGYIPLKTFGVPGIVLKMSADLAELVGKIDTNDPDSHLTDELILGGAAILTSAATPEYLTRGVPDFFTFINDVSQGRRSPGDMANSAAQFSTGFIPMSGFVRQAGQLFDPSYRDTSPQDVHGNMISKAWGKVRNEWLETAGLAGFAGLPPELNIFGEEVMSPMGVGDYIKSAVFSNNRDPDDPVVKEILRLDATGAAIHEESPNEESLSIRMPERVKRKGIGGLNVPVKLTPQEYHDYVKLAAGLKVGDLSVGGPPLKEALKQVMDLPEYKQKETTDEMRKMLLKKTISEYKSRAWQLMMMQPNVQDEINRTGRERVNKVFGRSLEQ